MSQERAKDAREAAMKSWFLWRNLDPGELCLSLLGACIADPWILDSPYYPTPFARMNLARLFLELADYTSALEILQQVENENDEDAEIWYLSGYTWYLLGEQREKGGKTDEQESKEECWSEGKLCFENYLKVSCFVYGRSKY
jgi:hypothetical protein